MSRRTDPWTRLAHLWPLLAETRIPGTRRPWRAPDLTGLQRAERDARLRDERHLAEIFLEAQPAPLHLDVLDTLTALWRQLAGAAAELATPESPLPPRVAPWAPLADPRPLLEWCSERARIAQDGVAVDRPAWDMLHVVERALGEVWDGQKLAAVCPWCRGGQTRDQTWRVRMLPGGVAAIVCESGICDPPDRDADRWRGNPAWPLWEWSWLAGRLEAEERRAAAAS